MTNRPETGTSLGNDIKTVNNVELQHEKALNNIDRQLRKSIIST